MNMTKLLLAAAVGAAAVLAAALPASAFPSGMVLVGKTNPPIGHYEFCKRNPNDCVARGSDAGPTPLNEKTWKDMVEVNYQVNTAVRPATDQELYGREEYWTYPKDAGDCEDYALLKQKRLVDLGLSLSNLLLTVVLQPNGDGHAVLTVRTDRGDFVLDNMRNKILLWSDTEYTYLKRQSADDPSRWVKLQDGRAVTVTSSSK